MLLLAAALIFLGAHANDFYEVGALNVEDVKTIKYSTGPFSIVYDPQGSSLIKVYDGTSLVWFTASSEKNKTFAGAATITETVEQNGGVFVIDDKVTDTCDQMDITDHGSTNGSSGHSVVYFNGTICSSTAFSLTFQADRVADAYGSQTWSHLQLNYFISENSPYNQLRLSYGCAYDEHFYGFGAQYSKFDMKGHRLPLFLSEQGVGRGLEPLTFILDEVSKGSGMKIIQIKLLFLCFRRNLVHYLHSCSFLPDQLP